LPGNEPDNPLDLARLSVFFFCCRKKPAPREQVLRG
jgi:hypothetical protein